MLPAVPVAQSWVIRASAVVHAIGFAGILAAISLGPRTAVGQTPIMRGGCPEEPARFHTCALAKARTFNPPRTVDGTPDLQGFWTGRPITATFLLPYNGVRNVPGILHGTGSHSSD